MSNELCGCIQAGCDKCYTYSVSYCPSALINIPCNNLTYNSSYYFWIRDKFGNVWQDTVLGLIDGSFNVNTANFPIGMFVPNFGALDMFLTTDSLGSIAQVMYFYGQEYNCIIFSVDYPIYITDDSGCNYLTDDSGNYLIAE